MLGTSLLSRLSGVLSRSQRATLMVRGFGLVKVPMLFWASPVVEELTDEQCVLRIPLGWRTRNHLRSMYIGVLATGADAAGGLMALDAVRQAKVKVAILFKDMRADFLKRATADVKFTCRDGMAIRDAIARTVAGGERQNLPVHVEATIGQNGRSETVAKFEMTLSVKRQS